MPEFVVDQVVQRLLELGGAGSTVDSLKGVEENITFKLPPELRD